MTMTRQQVQQELENRSGANLFTMCDWTYWITFNLLLDWISFENGDMSVDDYLIFFLAYVVNRIILRNVGGNNIFSFFLLSSKVF